MADAKTNFSGDVAGGTMHEIEDANGRSTVFVDSNGSLSRTQRFREQDGTEVVVTTAGGSRQETRDAPDGSRLETTRFSDGTTEVSTVTPEPNDGFLIVTQHRDGTTTTSRQSTDPDGRQRTTVTLPDGSIEVSTSLTRNLPDGSQVAESTGPDGTVTTATIQANGRADTVTSHPDGTSERSSNEQLADGSTVYRSTAADGREMVVTKSTDPDGTNREVTVLPDGTTETATVRGFKGPDGSDVIETTGPQGSMSHTTRPDGSMTLVSRDPDGSVRETNELRKNADGSVDHELVLADGTRQTMTQVRNPDGSIETLTTNSDGHQHLHTMGPDGSVKMETFFPDGTRQNTALGRDGTGTTTTTTPDGQSTQVMHDADRADFSGPQPPTLPAPDAVPDAVPVTAAAPDTAPDTAPAATGAAPSSDGSPAAEFFERNETGTVVTRELPNGAKQTTVLEPDGDIVRTTERVNPSTGATVVTRESPEGISKTTTLPDGTSTKRTTLPDGSVQTERVTRDPDGTEVTLTRRPDGTEEVRTSKVVRGDDGSVSTRTTGPEGDKVVQENGDGSRHEVLTLPDGRAETTDLARLAGGGFREKVTRADGSVEVAVIRKVTLPNGRESTQIVREDSVETQTITPDGNLRSLETVFDDGTSAGSTMIRREDGSVRLETFERDGSSVQTDHRIPVGDEPPRTVTVGSDGTRVEQFVDPAPPGRMQTVTTKPDGSREVTDLDLDGLGTTLEFGPDGSLQGSKQHVPLEDVEPFPEITQTDPDPGRPVDPTTTTPSEAHDAPEPGESAGGLVEPELTARPRDVFDDVVAQDATVGAPGGGLEPELVGARLDGPTGDVEIDVAGDSRPTEEIDDFAETVNVGFEERDPISKDPDDPGSLIEGGGSLEEPPGDLEFDLPGDSVPSELVDVPAEPVNYEYTETDGIGPDPDVQVTETVEQSPTESW